MKEQLTASSRQRRGLYARARVSQQQDLHERAGSKFAAELRTAKQAGTPLVLVHENDPALGGCEFAKVMEHTPSDLIQSGLYNSIAIALHPEPHRSVSHVLFLRAFGVKTDSRFSALTQRLTRRKKEENTVVKLSRRGSSAPGIESSSAP